MKIHAGPGMGLGAMRLSSGEVLEEDALRVLREAYTGGVRHFDTADVYAPSADEVGHNERLLRRALEELGSEPTVATKGGLRRKGKSWIPDGRARHLRDACEKSLRALGVECVDLYQLHAVDPKVPLETSVRALARLHREGKIGALGLCNVNLEQLEIACAIAPVASVQVELSPFCTTPLKNGLVRFCVERGIAILAHSPLGGYRRAKRLEKLAVLAAVARRHGVNAQEVALAWLRSVHPDVVPLPGPTRVETLRSCLHAMDLTLTDEDLSELDGALPAGRILRRPRPRPDATDDGEVVLFVGYPGAGKSRLAKSWVERGYQRLNRDEVGGRLAGLLPMLEEALERNERRLVLDNTYPRRESRFDVVEAAHRCGVPVRCVWLQTTLEQAQVNAVRRMIARHGRLLDEDDLKDRGEANDFGPEAQLRYRRELEPPREDEGFSAVERVPFRVDPQTPRSNRAIFVDAIELTPERRAALSSLASRGYRLYQLLYAPGLDDEQGRRREPELELETYFCPHPPGPPRCWCRKPLPGLLLKLEAEHDVALSRSILAGDSAADAALAAKLGMKRLAVGELFERADEL